MMTGCNWPYTCVLAFGCIFLVSSCRAQCGLVAGIICNGGACERGNCVCPSYLIGPDCNYQCPGPAESPCNGKGACLLSSNAPSQSAICSCADRFRGPACTVSCPMFSESICSGRGMCDNNGTCACNDGFVGSDCSIECRGGSANPCSGKGMCLPDGSCACDAGRYGERCQASCASNNGILCSGRGIILMLSYVRKIMFLLLRRVLEQNWPVCVHAIYDRNLDFRVLW